MPEKNILNTLNYREQDAEKGDVTAGVWLSGRCEDERKLQRISR